MSHRTRAAAILALVALTTTTACWGSDDRDSGTRRVAPPTSPVEPAADADESGAEDESSAVDEPTKDGSATDEGPTGASNDPDTDTGGRRDDAPSTGTTRTWSGPATGGFTGDTITFIVTADGRLTDVALDGHWRCDGSTERIDIGGFPDDVALTGVSFSTVQRADYQLQWEISGSFDGALATGTVRIMSSTDCDTYELDWTASPG